MDKAALAGLLNDPLFSTYSAKIVATPVGVKGEEAGEGRKRRADFDAPSPVKPRSSSSSRFGLGGSAGGDRKGASPNSPYATRGDRGVVELSFHGELPAALAPEEKASKPENEDEDDAAVHGVEILGRSRVRLPFRYMFDDQDGKLERVLDTAMTDFHGRVEALLEQRNAAAAPEADGARTVEILSPVTHVGQDEITVFGRLVRLVDTLFLEGDSVVSSGSRVRLDLSRLANFTFFPGQLVCLRGTHSNGDAFVAREVLPESLPPRLAPPCDAAAGLSIIAAAGPFTLADDLSAQPLSDLLDVVRQRQPDVLVLMGPFVDAGHPLIFKGDTGGAPFEDLFLRQIDMIADALRPLHTRCVIVPASTDAFHVPIFPQPPFPPPKEPLGLRPDQLIFAPNPATFRVGSIVVGASSQDVLQQLAAQAISSGGGDRISRLATALLHQRSYFPLCPAQARVDASDGSGSLKLGVRREGPVDLTLADHFAMEVCPDILLLPSRLARFCSLLAGEVVCVNPGPLCKPSAGGAFASITVHAPAAGQAAGGIQARTRVDITKV
jgi:hypothetical protein